MSLVCSMMSALVLGWDFVSGDLIFLWSFGTQDHFELLKVLPGRIMVCRKLGGNAMEKMAQLLYNQNKKAVCSEVAGTDIPLEDTCILADVQGRRIVFSFLFACLIGEFVFLATYYGCLLFCLRLSRTEAPGISFATIFSHDCCFIPSCVCTTSLV